VPKSSYGTYWKTPSVKDRLPPYDWKTFLGQAVENLAHLNSAVFFYRGCYLPSAWSYIAPFFDTRSAFGHFAAKVYEAAFLLFFGAQAHETSLVLDN
jgi:hypothetical protein